MPFLNRENIVTCAAMSGAATLDQIASRTLVIDPELMGGNFWTSKTAPGTNLARTGSAVLNGFGYTSTGYSGTIADATNPTTPTSFNARYDDTANSWTSKANAATNGASPITFTSDGRYYRMEGLINTTSGVDSNGYAYDDATDVWTSLSPSGATAAFDKTHGTTLDGYGFAISGSNFAAGGLNAVNRFDNSNNTFTAMAIITGSVAAGAGFKQNELYNLTGGLDNGGNVRGFAYRYNHGTNAWTTLNGTMGTAKYWCGGFTIAGLGYAVSGLTTGAATTTTVDDYNPDADAYTNRAVIPTTTAGPTNFTQNGNGYIFGGTNAVAFQYRSTCWYQIPGAIKRTLRTPTRVFVGIEANGRPCTFPVRIRTDNSNWQFMEANADSLLKQGQVLTTVLAIAAGVRNFELQVGVPRWTAGLGGGAWGTRANVTAAKSSAGGSHAGGYGYSQMGTIASTLQTTNYQLNDSVNVWTTRTAGGAGQTYKDVAGFGLNGLSTIAGGADNTPTYQTAVSYFDDVANAWSTRTGLTTARSQAAAYCLNGLAYVVGGKDGGGAKQTNEQFNDSTNAWATKTNVTAIRRGAGAFAITGFGYIVAGHDGTNPQATVYEYNDFADAWTTKTAITTAREGVSAYQLGGVGFVTDGIASAVYQTEHQQFDRASNIWATRAGDSFGGRAYCSTFAINGGGFVCNGTNGTDQNAVKRYSLADAQVVVTVSLFVEEAR